MTALVRYETARQALADAVSVDEVKDIHDKAEALRVYARIAGDPVLEQNAAEIRLRAKRRWGELFKASGVILSRGGRKPPNTTNSERESVAPVTVTLKDIGIKPKFSSEAQQAASISERAFEAMVHRVREQIERGHKAALSTEEKKERRAVREKVLGGIQSALPIQKFGVILADPEWRFEPWSRATGMDRAADNHYPTSVTEVIATRDVASIAADDCVLFLWATAPMIREGLAVMETWGFEYKSQAVWVKDKIGTGYWFRNQHELLLVGTRGKIPAPAMGEQWSSVLEAPVLAHSQKPDSFLDLIEQYFPTLPKIELNRRGPARPGWSAWGNESEPPHDPETGEIAA